LSTLEQDRAAMRAKGLTPIPLAEHRVCLGREGDDQCTACTLRVAPADYTGYFPALAVIVPNLQERGLGEWRRLHCLDRRTDDTHFPGASVGGDQGGVGAVAHAAECAPSDGVGVSLPRGASCNHSAHRIGVSA